MVLEKWKILKVEKVTNLDQRKGSSAINAYFMTSAKLMASSIPGKALSSSETTAFPMLIISKLQKTALELDKDSLNLFRNIKISF
jgi:hypothetical protein